MNENYKNLLNKTIIRGFEQTLHENMSSPMIVIHNNSENISKIIKSS